MMKKRVLILSLLLLGATTTGLRADDVPDVATIRERHAAAVGPDPENYREVTVYKYTTSSGTDTYVQRGKDYRETDKSSAGTTISGFYKGDRWFQNENGHTVIDEDDPGNDKTPDQYTTTVAHVTSPVDAYAVSRLNLRRAGTITYYDPKTWLIVRRETVGPSGRAITIYDQFKTFGKETLATHWTVHDERTRLDGEVTLADYATENITDADVAIVENSRLLVEFPTGVTKVQLPATFLDNGHIVIRVASGTKQFDFLLDSGASTMAIDPSVAASLKLPIRDRYQNSANAGRTDAGTVVLPELRIGSLTMHDVNVTAIANGSEESESIKSVGLLGFDFICEMGIKIDYEKRTVTAEKFGTYTPPEGKDVVALPVRLGGESPLATVKINAVSADRMLLDTGGAGAVLIFDYFTRRHPEAIVDHNNIGARSGGIRFFGIGGPIDTRPIAFDRFDLGNVTFRDFVGYVVTSGSYGTVREDGAIGPDFLRFFDVYLDYPDGMIYLTPNARAKRAAEK